MISIVQWYSIARTSLIVYSYQHHLGARETLFPRNIKCIEKEKRLMVAHEVLDMIPMISKSEEFHFGDSLHV